MSIFYMIVLLAVFAMLLGVTIEAVLAVSRTKPWPVPETRLTLVETHERRSRGLPFVGNERRTGHEPEAEAEAEADAGLGREADRRVA